MGNWKEKIGEEVAQEIMDALRQVEYIEEEGSDTPPLFTLKGESYGYAYEVKLKKKEEEDPNDPNIPVTPLSVLNCRENYFFDKEGRVRFGSALALVDGVLFRPGGSSIRLLKNREDDWVLHTTADMEDITNLSNRQAYQRIIKAVEGGGVTQLKFDKYDPRAET